MTDPWDERYIYLHLVGFYGKLVGKCTVRPMDPSWVYILDLFFRWIFDGFDPMVNHHEKPPFGRMCSTFSKHRTSKSKLVIPMYPTVRI